jgi:hypothetical protein
MGHGARYFGRRASGLCPRLWPGAKRPRGQLHSFGGSLLHRSPWVPEGPLRGECSEAGPGPTCRPGDASAAACAKFHNAGLREREKSCASELWPPPLLPTSCLVPPPAAKRRGESKPATPSRSSVGLIGCDLNCKEYSIRAELWVLRSTFALQTTDTTLVSVDGENGPMGPGALVLRALAPAVCHWQSRLETIP